MSLSGYSGKICSSEVKDTDPAVLCDLCGKWMHTDCTRSLETQSGKLKESAYCIMELSFFTVKNNDLQELLSDSHNNNPKPIPRKMNKKMNNLKIHLAVTTMIFHISKN